MSTGDRNTLELFGEQLKDTTHGATHRAALARLGQHLRGLNLAALTDTGRANLCKRHGVSAAELAAEVARLQRPHAPAPELLLSIGAAVAPARRHQKGGAKW